MAYDAVFAFEEHPGVDGEGVVAGSGEFDGGVLGAEFKEDFVGGDADFGGVPGEAEDGDVVGDGLLEEGGGEGGDVFDDGGDDVGAAGDLGFDASGGLGVEQPVDGGDHADDLLLGDLHAAAYALTGAVVGGGEVDEVFSGAEKEASVLGASDAFAAGEGDEVEAHAGVLPEVFDGGHVGCGVEVAGDVVLMGDFEPRGLIELAGLRGVAVVGHDGGGGEGTFVVFEGFDGDDFYAAEVHGVVVLVAVGALDDDFVFGELSCADILRDVGGLAVVGVLHCGGGGEGEAGGGAVGDESGFAAEPLCDAGSGGGLQLVEADGVKGGAGDGGADWCGHYGPGESGEGALGVDDAADVERGVVVFAGGGCGFGGGFGEGFGCAAEEGESSEGCHRSLGPLEEASSGYESGFFRIGFGIEHCSPFLPLRLLGFWGGLLD